MPADGTTAARDLNGLCAVMRHPAMDPERVDAFHAFAVAAEITSLGDLPMTVMTADQRTLPGDLADTEVQRLNAVWDEGVQHWTELSTNSTVITVEDTGHHIEIDQPTIVTDAVLGLLP